MPAGELLEALRQILGAGHSRAVDEDGNDADAPSERGLDLDAHEVARVVQATAIVRVGAREPMPADDGDKRVAPADALGKDIDEIEAGRDIVDVEEDALVSEPFSQAIVDSSREAAGVLAPVTDEDAAQHVDVLPLDGN